jgi:hypothetical protein
MHHFDTAFNKIPPSVSPHDKHHYDNLKKTFGNATQRI